MSPSQHQQNKQVYPIATSSSLSMRFAFGRVSKLASEYPITRLFNPDQQELAFSRSGYFFRLI